MIVRTFLADDAPTIAKLHRHALPEGFLSSLGDRFLAALYTELARAPRTCVWVATDTNGLCVGFVAGSVDIRHAYRHVFIHGLRTLGPILLPKLLRAPVLRRIIQTSTYPLHRKRKSAFDRPPRATQAELLAIAVADDARGHGLGRRLVDTFETTLKSWGHNDPYRVVTHAEDPRSNSFYRALGFTFVEHFRHHQHTMSLYTKNPHAPVCGIQRGPDHE